LNERDGTNHISGTIFLTWRIDEKIVGKRDIKNFSVASRSAAEWRRKKIVLDTFQNEFWQCRKTLTNSYFGSRELTRARFQPSMSSLVSVKEKMAEVLLACVAAGKGIIVEDLQRGLHPLSDVDDLPQLDHAVYFGRRF
jgi:hypothetical protein